MYNRFERGKSDWPIDKTAFQPPVGFMARKGLLPEDASGILNEVARKHKIDKGSILDPLAKSQQVYDARTDLIGKVSDLGYYQKDICAMFGFATATVSRYLKIYKLLEGDL
jgi:hypothetical protein